jgi:hypothetical protein
MGGYKMSYPMAHLCIAYNILTTTPQIKEPGDFMLGVLAPGSVHFRDNYNSDMKKASHLCIGGEKWGEITNNQEWLENVLAFLQENKHKPNIDFIYGYCTHILTDLRNNIKIWTPFRLSNKDDLEKGVGKAYGKELYAIDYELYLLHPQQAVIWEMLESAVGYDVSNVAVGSEIDKMKKSIIHNQFIGRESSEVLANKYIMLENIQEFISEESIYIKKVLY